MTSLLTGLTTVLAPLSIPSPSDGVWNLGPIPVRGYALCIILGIVAAIWIGERRWQARGGKAGEVQDLAIWAVPFGLVGARLYHVATDSALYFGEGKHPIEALYIWRGGLGIWGAVALGAVGIYIGARRKGIRMLPMVDALAPGLVLAQAIGRWGNWFNQELYGKATSLPWGLEIDQSKWPTNCDHPYNGLPCNFADGTTFHPTYLYEFFWNLGVFGLLLWAERRFKLGYGRVFALYVMGYTLGRGWIEYLRIDDVQLENFYGLRFNVWTSIVLFVLAAAYFVLSSKRKPGREDSVYRDGFVSPGPAGAVEEDEEVDDKVAVGPQTPKVEKASAAETASRPPEPPPVIDAEPAADAEGATDTDTDTDVDTDVDTDADLSPLARARAQARRARQDAEDQADRAGREDT